MFDFGAVGTNLLIRQDVGAEKIKIRKELDTTEFH